MSSPPHPISGGVHDRRPARCCCVSASNRPPGCMSAANLIDPRGSGSDLEASEPLDLDASGVENGLDRLLAVGDRRLVEEGDLLEVAVEPSLDDLGQRLLGLAVLAGGGF